MMGMASMAPMKVAIVAASQRGTGGQSVQAQLLVRGWHHDPAVRVRFIAIDPELPAALRWVERIPWLRTLVRMPFYLRGLWRGTRDADIVHIFSASYWSFLLATVPAWLIARLLGKRTLINYHSGEARDHLKRSPIAVRVLGAADRLVVPTEYLVNVFREFDLRAEAVPNIVDSEQFCYRPRRPLRPRLICTRGFHRYYSVDVVVRAFGLIKKEFPEARLCLVGKGPMQREIEDLVKQLQLVDVEFVGPIPHKDTGRYYDQSDIFINASWVDNMPVSILEAFASGTPVVTTAPEGILYVVEHERTGLLCEPGDWAALGENVTRLLREPDLALCLAQNAHDESHRYRWEAVRTPWLEVYGAMHTPGLQDGDSSRLPSTRMTPTGANEREKRVEGLKNRLIATVRRSVGGRRECWGIPALNSGRNLIERFLLHLVAWKKFRLLGTAILALAIRWRRPWMREGWRGRAERA
jgi:glycosyltransferase involved in cell wall biosynthesis